MSVQFLSAEPLSGEGEKNECTERVQMWVQKRVQ
jgi:hypothetical protein